MYVLEKLCCNNIFIADVYNGPGVDNMCLIWAFIGQLICKYYDNFMRRVDAYKLNLSTNFENSTYATIKFDDVYKFWNDNIKFFIVMLSEEDEHIDKKEVIKLMQGGQGSAECIYSLCKFFCVNSKWMEHNYIDNVHIRSRGYAIMPTGLTFGDDITIDLILSNGHWYSRAKSRVSPNKSYQILNNNIQRFKGVAHYCTPIIRYTEENGELIVL